jgi:anti-sigma28 factor (negative regulator of flagellin synthesis)
MANSITGVGSSSPGGQAELIQTSRTSQQGVQNASPSVDVAAPPAQVGDATDLSNLGNLIATAAMRAGAQPSIRSGLVASLNAQIAAGTYNPDLNHVAARVAAAIKS